jgi:hypothetical protein
MSFFVTRNPCAEGVNISRETGGWNTFDVFRRLSVPHPCGFQGAVFDFALFFFLSLSAAPLTPPHYRPLPISNHSLHFT